MTTEAGQTKALRVVDVLNRGMAIATMTDTDAAVEAVEELKDDVLAVIASGGRNAAEMATAVLNTEKVISLQRPRPLP